MTIADKIIRAKNDYDEVYEAGKEKIISIHPEKTVSGSYISVNDVSELPHSVKCKISGVTDPTSVSVKKCGKNLFDINSESKIEDAIYTPVKISESTIRMFNSISSGGMALFFLGMVDAGTTLFASGNLMLSESLLAAGGSARIWYRFEKMDGTRLGADYGVSNPYAYGSNGAFASKITAPTGFGEKLFIYMGFGYNLIYKEGYYVDFTNLQIELGGKETEYEPYNGQILTLSADGTVEGMISTYPQMNIFTDNADAMLDVTYRQSKGMQTEYDRFWDSYQQNGKKTNYRYAFANNGWNPDNFKPKYKITIGASDYEAVGMFHWFGSSEYPILDYRTVKDMIDTSAILSAQEMFQSARIDYIDVDFSNCKSIYSCFNGGWQSRKLTHVKLKVSEKCTSMDYAFGSCSDLTDLFFTDGSVIAANLSVSACPLTKESITSIINALSSSVTGKTVTFQKTAKEAAFTADEWATLIGTKTNWTISLV